MIVQRIGALSALPSFRHRISLRGREGPLVSLHCKKCSAVRSVIKVPSFPSYDGKRRSGLSATWSFVINAAKVRNPPQLSYVCNVANGRL